MKTNLTKTALAVALACTATLSVAQSTPPVDKRVEVKYDWATRENSAVVYEGTCPIHLAPVVDQRQNKDTFGANFINPLLSPPLDVWVADGLSNLKQHGFKVDQTGDASALPQDGVTVRTTLTRAYTWQIGLKLFGMVAVKAQFADRNGVLQEKYYRAHGDKTNMWGADSEFATTLNYGLNNLLPVMAADLVSLCKGNKVEVYSYAGPDEKKK